MTNSDFFQYVIVESFNILGFALLYLLIAFWAYRESLLLRSKPWKVVAILSFTLSLLSIISKISQVGFEIISSSTLHLHDSYYIILDFGWQLEAILALLIAILLAWLSIQVAKKA